MKVERRILLAGAAALCFLCIVFSTVFCPDVLSGSTEDPSVKGSEGPCLGDLDIDGDVDGTDLSIFKGYLRDNSSLADIDGSGSTDNDPALFASEFGREDCPTQVYHVTIVALPPSGAVPLEVAFSAVVTGGVPPYSFAWDIDNDGQTDETVQDFHHLFLNSGTYTVSLAVTDSEGEVSQDQVLITAMIAPEVTASATPLHSDSPPLNVSFSCSVTHHGSDIALYQWDFDGDGTFDWSSEDECSCSHTYAAKGAFQATVQVTDTQGLQASDTVFLYVGSKPRVLASAAPMTGAAPLEVHFNGSVTDSDSTISVYQWDFDGDGTFDWNSNSEPTVSHTYASAGMYRATLQVTDSDGIPASDTVVISVAGAPVPLPSAYPLKGNAPLRVTFFADGQDFDGSPDRFQWDFDGDGTFDWSSTDTTVVTHTYDVPGVYHPVLRVVDNQGLSADKALTIEATESGPLATLTALPGVNPPNGPVPLEVHLIGDASAPYVPVCQYEWDFDGDGIFDWSEQVGHASSLGSTVIGVNAANSPAFVDLDSDGDFDLVVGDSDGKLHLYTNRGSAHVPDYADSGVIEDSDGNVIDVGFHSRPVFGDLDGDGDQDMIVGNEEGTVLFYENRGDATTPSWHDSGPFVRADGEPIRVEYNSCPALADVDGDMDLDLLVGDYFGHITEFRNIGDRAVPSWSAPEALTDTWGNPIDVGYYSTPRLGDIDSDGDLDLIVGADSGRVYLILNQGGTATALWEERGELLDHHDNPIDVGYYSRPFLVDIDADGDLDLFVGNGSGFLAYYGNTGTDKAPVWTRLSARYNSLGTDYRSAPYLVDIDHDGDLDLFTGAQDGTIYFFRNNGTTSSPVWTPLGRVEDMWGNYMDAGENSRPVLADMDADGDYDLLFGSASGPVYLSRNEEGASGPVWRTPERLMDSGGSEISPGPNTRPVLADIDNDGDMDLFVGVQTGTVYCFRNDGTASLPAFVNTGVLRDIEGNSIDTGSGANPVFDDSDMDGDLDLFIGTDAGKIFFYRNVGSPSASLWEAQGEMHDSEGRPVSVAGTAVPAFGDIDGDRDSDLFVGQTYGNIIQYIRTGSLVHTYSVEGTYHPALKVTDCNGAEDTASLTIVAGGPGAPYAMASLDPSQGTGPLEVHFYGSGTDPDGSISLFEWDFDGDGVYDWSSTDSGDTTYTYDKVGEFYPVLRVTDNDGKTITHSLKVRVEPNVHASCSGSVNPAQGVMGTISTTLGAGANVTVRIVDQYGNVVRTLLNSEWRDAGDYTDSWDGRDDDEQVVRDGVYYFVLEIDIAGQTWTYDLRKDAPYPQIVPPRSFPSMFAPYNNEVFPISYSLAKPSAVSLYIRTTGTNGNPFDRVKTLLSWEYRSAGDHVEIWDGTDDQGVTVPGGMPTGVTLWAWELPDNAMVVSGGAPIVSDVAADTNYFSPALNPYAAVPHNVTVVRFTLSGPADVEAIVKDENGLVVQRIDKPDMPAGTGSIVWDGRDQDGNLLSAGNYTVGITAIDSHGNRSQTIHASIVLFY